MMLLCGAVHYIDTAGGARMAANSLSKDTHRYRFQGIVTYKLFMLN